MYDLGDYSTLCFLITFDIRREHLGIILYIRSEKREMSGGFFKT